MGIQKANPFDDEEEDAEGFVEDAGEENNAFSFRQLMDAIYEHKDIIVTIPADQEEALRSGLAVRKSKDNAKYKRAGITPSSETLSFLSYPAKDENGKEMEGAVTIRIKLGPRKAINVLALTLPDDSI